jgi:predicted amidohydrolase
MNCYKTPQIFLTFFSGIFLLTACFDKSNAQLAEQDNSEGIKIAGYQMIVSDDINSNKQKILNEIQKAAEEGAEFLVTPEGSLSGYTSNFSQEQVRNALTEIESEAKKLNIGLMLGTCYKEVTGKNEYCYNQVRVYSPDGRFAGAYSKILRCSPLDLPGTGEMVDYVEGELKTFDWKGYKFGILICNDLWATPGYTTMPNPYLAWKLKQLGHNSSFIVSIQVLTRNTDSFMNLQQNYGHILSGFQFWKSMHLVMISLSMPGRD